MKKLIFISFLFLNFIQLQLNAQQRKIDSLKVLLKNDKPDSLKVRHLYNLSDECETVGSLDEAVAYGKELILLADKLLEKEENTAVKNNILKFKAGALGIFGIINEVHGKYPEALKNHFASMEIREKLGDFNGVAASKNNIGLVYVDQGNYVEALKIYFSALKTAESIANKSTTAMLYTNIGLVYANQGNVKDALKYDFISLKMKKELGDKEGMISVYNSIATAYYMDSDFEGALKNFSESLKLAKEVDDKQSVNTIQINLGAVYFAFGQQEKNPVERRKKYELSLKQFLTSLDALKATGAKPGMTGCYVDIGTILFELQRYGEAKEYLLTGRDLALEIGYKDYAKNSFQLLTRVDSAQGNYKSAYDNHKKYILYSDSLNNEETRKQSIQSQMTYDFEKKEAVANAEHKKELENQGAIAKEKSRKQNLIIVFVVSGLFLVLVFAGFIFRSLRITRKQKSIIVEQKEIVEKQKQEVEQQKIMVEEHQKEIIDSIRYARRIQQSLLPTELYIEKNLNRLKETK